MCTYCSKEKNVAFCCCKIQIQIEPDLCQSFKIKKTCHSKILTKSIFFCFDKIITFFLSHYLWVYLDPDPNRAQCVSEVRIHMINLHCLIIIYNHTIYVFVRDPILYSMIPPKFIIVLFVSSSSLVCSSRIPSSLSL